MPRRKAIFLMNMMSTLRIYCTCVTRMASTQPGDIGFFFVVLPSSPATETPFAASLLRTSVAVIGQFVTPELMMLMTAVLVARPRRCAQAAHPCPFAGIFSRSSGRGYSPLWLRMRSCAHRIVSSCRRALAGGQICRPLLGRRQ